MDVSEQLEHPRIFVIESSACHMFVLIGGERVYWLLSNGTVKTELKLFREWGDEEYWTTQLFDQGNKIIVIYEAGVLVISVTLEVQMHKHKLYNDDFMGIEGKYLKFTRDHDTEWCMPIEG